MDGLQAGAEGHSGAIYIASGSGLADATRLELERYRPLIEAALAYTDGAWTWDMLVEEVVEGRAFLMVSASRQSVAVLQPVHDLHVWSASGSIPEILEMEEEATRKARASAFDHMTLNGRKGWERVFARRGWRPAAGLVKDL